MSFTSLDPFTCKAHWRSQVSKAFTVSSPWFCHVFTYYKVININSKHLNKYHVYSQLVISLTRGLAFTRIDAKFWQSGLHWKRPVANHQSETKLVRTNRDAPVRIVISYHLIIIWKYYILSYSYHNISILSLISYTHIPRKSAKQIQSEKCKKLMTNISPWNPLISTWLQLTQILSSAVDLLTKARCNSPARYLSDLCNFEFWILGDHLQSSKIQNVCLLLVVSCCIPRKSYWEVYCKLWGKNSLHLLAETHEPTALLAPSTDFISALISEKFTVFKQLSNHTIHVFCQHNNITNHNNYQISTMFFLVNWICDYISSAYLCISFRICRMSFSKALLATTCQGLWWCKWSWYVPSVPPYVVSGHPVPSSLPSDRCPQR